MSADDLVLRRDMIAGARIDRPGIRASFLAAALASVAAFVMAVIAFIDTRRFFEPDYTLFALALLLVAGTAFVAYYLRPRNHLTVLLRDGSALVMVSRDATFLNLCLEAFERLWLDEERARASLYLHAGHRSVDFGPAISGAPVETLVEQRAEVPDLPLFPADGAPDDAEAEPVPAVDAAPDPAGPVAEPELQEPEPVAVELDGQTGVSDAVAPEIVPDMVPDAAEVADTKRPSLAQRVAARFRKAEAEAEVQADVDAEGKPPAEDTVVSQPLPDLPPLSFTQEAEPFVPHDAPVPDDVPLPEPPTHEQAETWQVSFDAEDEAFLIEPERFDDVRPRIQALARLLHDRASGQDVADAIDVLELLTRRGVANEREERALHRALEVMRSKLSMYPAAIELMNEVAVAAERPSAG